MLQSAEVQLRFFENRPKKRAIPVRRKYLSKPVSKGVTALNEECHDGVIVQADPIGIKSGENHLYIYVQNNPINLIDPEGLRPQDDCIADANAKYNKCLELYDWNHKACVAACNLIAKGIPQLYRICWGACQTAVYNANKGCREYHRRLLERCNKCH